MGVFRVCKRFTVESGHMLTGHPERCRFPHGHTRTVEVVLRGEALDANGMVLDFKALKKAVEPIVEAFDHSLAVQRGEPLLPELLRLCPEGVLVFDEPPTTEVIARHLFESIAEVLARGFEGPEGPDGEPLYRIAPGQATLERVRVWETPTSWAEYGLEG
ncbi:MAG: 6-carboxytetrahydropterin synthase [Fimbriimonadales bacterium]|nr:6-carboxytetrahydropterin synthase [Fimbriimonadales bacterium]